MNGELLYEHLNEEDIDKLGDKFKDLTIDEAMYYYFGEEGKCMADLCGDDMEEVEILIHGIARGLDREDFDDEDDFIYQGGMKNLEMRKFFSARKIRAIRAKTDLSQEQFAKKVGLKRRTYQNYEEGQRIPSLLIVKAMKSVLVENIYCICSHRRLELNLNLLSELTQEYLEISMMGLYEFFWDVPSTRRVAQGDRSVRMYWVKADDASKEKAMSNKAYRKTDYYPEDLAACIKVANEYDCDEILFVDWDRSRAKGFREDKEYYLNIVTRINEVKDELLKQPNELRDHTYQLIKEYKADVAEGDPYKMLKWTDGFEYQMMEEKKAKEKAKKQDK